ncbi:hypothetical protein [Ekhidna sp.]|uniref:TlpA family protein disulfide reductase n=2 Tax=Ekhidna sp. TaxID=2608089 RepID=UPI0032986742
MRHLILLLFLSSWFTIIAQGQSPEIPAEFFREMLDLEPEDEDQKGIPVGETFSDSTFITIHGEEFSFINTGYQLTVVDFWFKGCRGCAQEKYFVREIIDKYKTDPRVRFVAITPSSEKGIQKVIKKYGEYYDDIISVGGFKNCEKIFRFKSFPCHVFVDQNGKVISKYTIPIFHPIVMDEYEKRILSFLTD